MNRSPFGHYTLDTQPGYGKQEANDYKLCFFKE